MKADFVEDGQIYKVTKCKRCGETVFLRYLSKKELDGGFTKIEEFEKIPDGWENSFELGMLCPVCHEKFESMKKDFMESTGK